ncbi:septum formation family protein [Blastococcus sp. Marseille-P5729]|uniref:septum formation family protein n=1 Tax=Blastococcus sp. Marseille-P5729 TaxID=2086582 RepID=UPI000D0FF2DC|nr:septum formation family protein [Blastococcus sp. Marseille-P5729]
MRAARLLLTVPLLVTVVACSPDADGESAKPAAAPQAGSCWELTGQQLDPGSAVTATEQEPTDCAASHNAITVDVVDLPLGQETALGELAQAGERLDAADDETWETVVLPGCAPIYGQAFASAAVDVNDKWAQAAYRATSLAPRVWLPTADQWADGQRWMRCDLVSLTETPLPIDAPGLDLGTVPEELALCLKVDSAGTTPLACDDPQANAQTLVTVVRNGKTPMDSAPAEDGYGADVAQMVCQDVVTAAYPTVTGEVKAAIPGVHGITGTFDCYIDRAAGAPLVT